jgi:hypothetical protein
MSAKIYNFENLLCKIVLTNTQFFPDTTFVPVSMNSYLAVIFLPSDIKKCGTKELIWCDVIMTYSTSKRLMTLLTTNIRLYSMAGSLSLPLAVKTIFTAKVCVLYRVSLRCSAKQEYGGVGPKGRTSVVRRTRHTADRLRGHNSKRQSKNQHEYKTATPSHKTGIQKTGRKTKPHNAIQQRMR